MLGIFNDAALKGFLSHDLIHSLRCREPVSPLPAVVEAEIGLPPELGNSVSPLADDFAIGLPKSASECSALLEGDKKMPGSTFTVLNTPPRKFFIY